MRRAFTLTEVSIVLLILAVVGGILLCTVQQVRLAAARTSCGNNLRQIGHGFQQYHDTHKKYPPGYTSESDAAGNDNGHGWGWAAYILPHIELAHFYRMFNFNLPIEDERNAHFVPYSGMTKRYRCPAVKHMDFIMDVGPRDANGQLMSTICRINPSSYVGNYGDSEPGPGAGTGVFFRNSAVKLDDITDGAGSTLMVGERSFKYGDATWVGAVTGSHLSAAPDSGLPTTPKHAASYVLGHTGGATEGLRRPLEVNHFSSAHHRGANFVFADGSVRFLSSSVDYNTLKALSTRAGGEKELGNY